MTKKMSFMLLLLALSFQVSAQDPDEGNPFRRRVSRNSIARKIISFVDHTTVGAIQTIVGLGHITYVAISEGPSAISVHSTEDTEIFQIHGEDQTFNGAAYSMGLFQIGDFSERHEGGHSVASAVLGPLYLPTVALSYLFQGHGSSFMEDWADVEAYDMGDIYTTGQVQVGYGLIDINGENHDVLVIQMSIDENQEGGDGMLSIYKAYHWLQSKVTLPLTKHLAQQPQNREAQPVYVEIDLLEKDITMLYNFFQAGNFSESGADHNLGVRIDTEQRYAHIETDPLYQMLHTQALSWKANYGFAYAFRDAFSISVTGGVQASIDILSPNVFYDTENNYFDQRQAFVTGGFQAEFRMTFAEYLTAMAGIERTWATTSVPYRRYYAALTNEFRNPGRNRRWAFLQALEMGVEYSREEIDFGTPSRPTRRVNRLQGTLGVRF